MGAGGPAYTVRVLPRGADPDRIDWRAIPEARIACYRWREGYAPEAAGRLVYAPRDGFILRMTCAESAPRTVCARYNDPVYTDSCLEFFADWFGDGRYVNLEMNAAGALLSCIGRGREGRIPIADLSGGAVFPVRAETGPGGWSVTARIPEALLCQIYGMDAPPFRPGYSFRGNFYKCGDLTEIPHYGMWSPVRAAEPDFHVPACFGTLTLREPLDRPTA